MPNWTQDELDAYYRKTSHPKPQPTVLHEPVATQAREAQNTGRVRVCVTGFRRRLLDPDNLCPKYFIDCLRYAGLIPNDREEDIALQVQQIKVRDKADERTEITINVGGGPNLPASGLSATAHTNL